MTRVTLFRTSGCNVFAVTVSPMQIDQWHNESTEIAGQSHSFITALKFVIVLVDVFLFFFFLWDHCFQDNLISYNSNKNIYDVQFATCDETAPHLSLVTETNIAELRLSALSCTCVTKGAHVTTLSPAFARYDLSC